VDIATLKHQARDCEKRGDAAAALDAYESILQHLQSSGVEAEGPLYVKIGDLSLKSGNKTQALEMFEQAADRYARLGSEKSVIALCVKVLRTDPRRTDVYVRFARSLLRYGHVEQTRLVLMDYAERAKLRKTLSTLERLGTLPATDLKAKLERFFETVDRGAPQLTTSGERPSVPKPEPPKTITQTTQHLALMIDESGRPVTPTPPEPVTKPDLVVTEIVPEPVQPAAAAMRTAPKARPEPEPEPVRVRRPAAAPVPQVSAHRRRRLGTLWNGRRTMPVWAWPAAAAAAVVVLAVGLFALGAVPFGGDLGAEQPGDKGVQTAPITRIMTAATFEQPLGPASPTETAQTDSPVQPAAAPERRAAASVTPAEATAELEPAAPVRLDGKALSAAQEAALSLQSSAPNVKLDDAVGDIGRIKVPTGVPLSSGGRRAAPPASRTASNEPFIAIDGLAVEGVARMTTSYQVVQRLANGERIALTVVPFSEAPPDDTGFLQVRATASDTAVGTVRFGDSYVTARAPVAPAELERLLGSLAERRPGGTE